MSFSPEEKAKLFDRLGKIDIGLSEIKGHLKATDRDLETLNKRGCIHGVERYEHLNKRIENSRTDLLQAIDGRMKNYKIVAGASGIIGLLGGYFIKHLA